MIVYDKYSFNTNREIDPNGFLRVEMSNITKAQIRPYLGREIPSYKDFNLDPNKVYNVLCPKEELEKAARTFNNLPLTREHIEVDVDDVPKEKIVGSLGDHATVDGGYLKNNLIIYDKKDIDLVLSGKKKELSCGYRYTPVQESGEYEGQHYDFKMTDIVGNHVALVKQGRAGRDVMVADSSKGLLETIKEKIMSVFDNDLVEDETKVNGEYEDDDDVEWITVHGVHIPIKKGEDKDTAVKNFLNRSDEAKKGIEKAFGEIDNILNKEKSNKGKGFFGGFYGDAKNVGGNNWKIEMKHEDIDDVLFTVNVSGMNKKEAQEAAFKEFQKYIKKDKDGFIKMVNEKLGKNKEEGDRKESSKEDKTESQKEKYEVHKKAGEELLERAAGVEDLMTQKQARKELEELEKLDKQVLTSGVLSDDEIDEYHQAFLRAEDYIVTKNTDNSWGNEDLDDEIAGKYREAKKYLRKAENSRKMGNYKEADEFEKKADELSGITKDADISKQEKVGVVMKEFKDGELKSGSGEKVTDPKQAIAIALSEADKVAKDENPEKQEELKKEKEMAEDMDELVQDSWGEETEYNGQTGHYLTTKSGHHIFIPNGTTTKEAISKHFDEIRSQKQKELGENPWRDKEGYESAKSSLERIKNGKYTIIGTAAAADLDRMIKELEDKAILSEEKEKEYDAKISQIYAECSKAIKEAEAESEEGKPESKVKEETEYEDVEFKAPRQRENVEKDDSRGESKWENPALIDIGIPEGDNVSYDILDSTMGQMSDGIWENSRAVEKYWQNANITKKDGTIGIKVNTDTSWKGASPYGEMSDEEIRAYFAKKIKAVVKEELGDSPKGEWSRDNESELQYLSRGNRKPVRVKDAYKLYDHLLGRNKK